MEDDILAHHLRERCRCCRSNPCRCVCRWLGGWCEYVQRHSSRWVTEQVSRLGVAATSTEEVETEPGSDTLLSHSSFLFHHMLTITSGNDVVYNTDSAQVEADVCKHFKEYDFVDVNAHELYQCALKLRSLHGYHLFEGMFDELMPFFEWCEWCTDFRYSVRMRSKTTS